MADSFYCTENANSCFDEYDCNATNYEFGRCSISLPHRIEGSQEPSVDYFGSEILMDSEERVRVLVEKEIQHLPRHDYLKRMRSGDLDLKFRREAVDWIWKVGFVSFESLAFSFFTHMEVPGFLFFF